MVNTIGTEKKKTYKIKVYPQLSLDTSTVYRICFNECLQCGLEKFSITTKENFFGHTYIYLKIKTTIETYQTLIQNILVFNKFIEKIQ